MKKIVSIITGLLLAQTVLCFTLNENHTGSGSDKNCQGNACEVTQIVPNPGGGYKFTNNSPNRKIKITIRFAFGLSCMSPTDIHLSPRQTTIFKNGGYCDPYSSNFE